MIVVRLPLSNYNENMKFWLMFATKVHILFEVHKQRLHRLLIPVNILKNRCDGEKSATSVFRSDDNRENYSPPFVNSMLMRAVTSPMFTAWSPFTSAQMGQQPESSWLSR